MKRNPLVILISDKKRGGLGAYGVRGESGPGGLEGEAPGEERRNSNVVPG